MNRVKKTISMIVKNKEGEVISESSFSKEVAEPFNAATVALVKRLALKDGQAFVTVSNSTGVSKTVKYENSYNEIKDDTVHPDFHKIAHNFCNVSKDDLLKWSDKFNKSFKGRKNLSNDSLQKWIQKWGG